MWTRSSPGFKRFAAAAILLLVAFAWPLAGLVRFALADELLSYIPLIPLVSAYLAWQERPYPADDAPARRLWALLPAAAGAALVAAFWLTRGRLRPVDAYALTTGAFLLGLASAAICFLGRRTLAKAAFPLGFLIFIVPMPHVLRTHLETGLQHASAVAAGWLFSASFTHFTRAGLLLHLSDITLEVAPECSGIHSTWVLLITSVLAAHLFLRRPWHRAAVVVAVLPLAILRNGFRIFVIGQLCIHLGPDMIDSPIHHQGGPIFFLLSLIPFLLLLGWLRRAELPTGAPS